MAPRRVIHGAHSARPRSARIRRQPKRHRARALLASATLAVLSVLAASCSSLIAPTPDLAGLYSRAASEGDLARNPVILIPGILGSRLVDDASGTTVWGAFAGAYANPRRPAGARLLSLPLWPGAPVSALRDDVRPDGVLDRIPLSLFGLPLASRAYLNILRTLGAGGYRDEELARADGIDYGNQHFTCFQFDYDWRLDNAQNAARLDAFIRKTRADVQSEYARRYGLKDRDVRFDLIAHSMGGLLARYYLRYGATPLPEDGSLPPITWAGAQHVDRLVMIGTPNAGSAMALRELVQGVRFAPLVVPRYPAAVLGTMPSVYQLLPRKRHGALVSASGQRLDPLDPWVWQGFDWGLAAPSADRTLAALLPEVESEPERRAIALDHQAKLLARARQFQAALDRPAAPPRGLHLSLYAGDAESTPAVLQVAENGALTVLEEAAGDGAVLRSSAVLDERVGGRWQPKLTSPIGWDHVQFLFTDHLGMTRDPAFTDNLLYLLLEAPSPRDH